MGFNTSALGKVGDWLGAGFLTASIRQPKHAAPLPRVEQAVSTAPAPPQGPTFADRARLFDALFGEGFVTPGGAEETQRLVRPMGLNAKHSFAHVGAGLGGPARLIAKTSGAWVTGYEPDPNMFKAAFSASAKAGLAKQAKIEPLDMAAFKLGKTAFHHCLVQEVLDRTNDSASFVHELAQSLKPGGHLVMVELAAGPERSSSADPLFGAWHRCLEREPNLWRAERTTEIVQRIGLDLRIVEEITGRHLAQTLSAWLEHVSSLRRNRPDRNQAIVLVNEAELWLRRCALMQAGKLRLVRWHAIKPLNWKGFSRQSV